MVRPKAERERPASIPYTGANAALPCHDDDLDELPQKVSRPPDSRFDPSPAKAGFLLSGDLLMADKPVCLVRKKEMEIGFLTDRGGGVSTHLPHWCAGQPQKGFGGEVKRSQLHEGLKVVAYRCPECQALRLYAPATE
jgi:hypothetical protein